MLFYISTKMKLWSKCLCLLSLLLIVNACSSDGEEQIVLENAPLLQSTNPENNASQVPVGDIAISLVYDQPIVLDNNAKGLLKFTGGIMREIKLDATNTIVVSVNVPAYERTCVLNIPEGVVTGRNGLSASAVTLQFTTCKQSSVDEPIEMVPLVTPSAMPAAQKLFDYLQSVYKTHTLSATMARDGVNGLSGSWNTAGADDVYAWTGKYPAINCFDYLHLAYSPANWIDYNDISAVKNWWENGGIVAAMWHWNVPREEGSSEYTSDASNNDFDPANALKEGTWENKVFVADLTEEANYLKLLQDAGIPVLWRPFHEAAGNIFEYNGGQAWFWWGKGGAEVYKKLWVYMFEFFQKKGINNLIWVWTTQLKDATFYPGDNYVDIIGRDLYGNSATDCGAQYKTIDSEYSEKMVALSECGYSSYTDSRVGMISAQWGNGARWLWFMPWYDSDNAATLHADQAWWQDAMSQPYVLDRDAVKEALK